MTLPLPDTVETAPCPVCGDPVPFAVNRHTGAVEALSREEVFFLSNRDAVLYCDCRLLREEIDELRDSIAERLL